MNEVKKSRKLTAAEREARKAAREERRRAEQQREMTLAGRKAKAFLDLLINDVRKSGVAALNDWHETIIEHAIECQPKLARAHTREERRTTVRAEDWQLAIWLRSYRHNETHVLIAHRYDLVLVREAPKAEHGMWEVFSPRVGTIVTARPDLFHVFVSPTGKAGTSREDLRWLEGLRVGMQPDAA